MRTRIGILCLLLALSATSAVAQVRMPNYGQMYCSGMYTTEGVPYDTYIISGEEARTQVTFQQGNYVYINKGATAGVKVGDEFQVVRVAKDSWPQWFYHERPLRRTMGGNKIWRDLGKLRVVKVQGDVATAQILNSCDYMQRGDYVLPFQERPAPALKMRPFDRWMDPSGRETAMVVAGKDYAVQAGTSDIIYVNLGSSQGVKVGDYFRVFRYQGTRHDTAYQPWSYQYKAAGFGRAPKAYGTQSLPQENVGEGVVLRVSPNSSTVLVTQSLKEIYLGDYVELENPEPVMAAPAPAPAPEPVANRAPTMTCAADRPSVIAGERVRISARASDADNDALTYGWRSNGGELSGAGSAVMLDTTGLRPARYTVTGRVSDGRGGAADCLVEVAVQPAPAPAQASKVNECGFRISSAGVDNVCKRILDDVAIRLNNDPRSRLVVVGYADPAEAGAERLAGQRAQNAKQYLISSGIADARIDVRSAGGQAGAGRQNRRVDLVWVPAGATY